MNNSPGAFLELPHNWQGNSVPSGTQGFQLGPSGTGRMELENPSPAMIRATSDSALHHSVLHKINAEKQKNLLNIQTNQIKQRKPESVSMACE